jgi:predicted nucleic acid-binding protein
MPTDYVLDANIIMSVLIGGRASSLSFLNQFNFYAPDYVFDELDTYTAIIRTKTKFSSDELSRYAINTFRRINAVPRLATSFDTLKRAETLCWDVDPKDVAYVALSLTLDCPLLTRDRPLHEGLRRQGFREVELFDVFLANLP